MSIEVVGIDESKKIQITCYKCCAILKYSRNDIQLELRSDYTGSKDFYQYIICPSCKNKLIL